MTREIIYNLLNMELTDDQRDIVNGILTGRQDLEEEVIGIGIEDQMQAIQSMLTKQIYLLNDDLIKPALDVIKSGGVESFFTSLQRYLEVEDNIHIEYNDRKEFIEIAKRNPIKFMKWLEAEDLIAPKEVKHD